MDDLLQWFGEQLDEDERIAREAEGDPVFDGTGIVIERNRARGFPDRVAGLISPVATHIAAWDPARVLREIDVDRELLAEYERLLSAHEAHRKEADRLARSDDDPFQRNALRREADYLPAMLHVLERWAKRKAAVYSDRLGFREEWAL